MTVEKVGLNCQDYRPNLPWDGREVSGVTHKNAAAGTTEAARDMRSFRVDVLPQAHCPTTGNGNHNHESLAPSATLPLRRQRGRPPKPRPGEAEPARKDVAALETVQTSIRLSHAADHALTRLVEILNANLSKGAEPHNRTSVLEDAVLDYFPAWQRAASN